MGRLLLIQIFLLLFLSLFFNSNAFVSFTSCHITSYESKLMAGRRRGMGFNKLSLPADQRKALLRGLTTQVLRHGKISTTLARAKEARRFVDRMITLAKKGTLHHRRLALAWIYDKKLVQSLFLEAPERYRDRQGGYCRVLREEFNRRGDNAKMATIELV